MLINKCQPQSKLVFLEYLVTQVPAARESVTPMNLPPISCNHLLSESFLICSRYFVNKIVARLPTSVSVSVSDSQVT